MNTAAIIAEYNPFHNGHRYHIEQTRKAGATHIVSIMSGNFVQRGDLAIFDKYARTKTALDNGVDLVIELPARYSLMSAEGFARGAVGIISALNCVDMLSFGSECGDISALKEASAAIEYCIHSSKFDEQIQRGQSYPAALQKALREYYTEDVSEIIQSPNNTLAIEYLSALDNIGSRIKPFTITRTAAHDSDISKSDEEYGELTSASAIRRKIRNNEDYSAFAPVVEAPTADLPRLECAVLAKLRMLSPDDFEQIYDCINGLGNRLYKASRAARSLDELYFLAKNKSVTLARVRRAVLCAFLGITKTISAAPPAYIHVLGMNERGKEILAAANSSIPVDTSLRALSKTSPAAHKQAVFEARLGDVYSLAFETPRPCGSDFTAKPIIVGD
ncbi:MAG: nucleotidyltransferase family protein [Oscillospiraceae bacterium]|nr:nucleotidyltransferase family protein [Oscillospiraceae bacterium]